MDSHAATVGRQLLPGIKVLDAGKPPRFPGLCPCS